MIKSIQYTAPGYGYYDVPEPEIERPDEVKIRVAYASICGSDIHMIKGDLDKIFGWEAGTVIPLGHEASGIVVELGAEANVKGIKVGDRVCYNYVAYCGKCYFCRSGQEHFCQNIQFKGSPMQEYMVVNEQQVFKLPENTDLAKACIVEPISVCLHGIDMCHIRPGARVAVSGGGGVGLIMLQLAKMSGACKLTLIEPVREKRELAIKLGAEYVIDPMHQDTVYEARKLTGGLGYDVVIETSGSPKACQPAYDMVSRGGLLQLFGIIADYKFPIDLMDMWMKEMTICTVFQSPYVFPRAIELLNHLNLDDYVKNIYPPEKYKEAFEFQMTGKPTKVMFKFYDPAG